MVGDEPLSLTLPQPGRLAHTPPGLALRASY